MEQNQVSILKELSVEALYGGIVSKLVSCPPDSEIVYQEVDSSIPPAEEKRKMKQSENASSSSSPSSLYSSSSREALVGEIRTRLSEYLVSSYSHVRHHLVKRFLSNITAGAEWPDDIILSFLDCLLDLSFTNCGLIGKEEQDKHPFALVVQAAESTWPPLTTCQPTQAVLWSTWKECTI